MNDGRLASLVAAWRATADVWERELEETYGLPAALHSPIGTGRGNIQNWINWLRGCARDVEAAMAEKDNEPANCSVDVRGGQR